MPNWLRQWAGDGIIGRIRNQATATLVRNIGVPFVDMRGAVRAPDIPLVHSDDVAIGEVAAEHLLERGFSQFAFYGVAGENWSDYRYDGFRRTVEASDGQCYYHQSPTISAGPTAWDRVQEDVAEWLRELPKPVAIMGGNDDLGERVLGAARRADFRVPDEIAVIGVDDDQATCQICDPPLSSVMRNLQYQGYRAAQLLDTLMAGAAAPREPILIRPSGVITRQSTDVLAIDDPFISQAVGFIRRHACDGISVADVLREVPLSRSVLQRRFKRIFGKTVSDAIIATRVERAQELLLETDLPLRRIAELAGFQHQQYLGAVFRKRVGTSPARYRKQKEHVG